MDFPELKRLEITGDILIEPRPGRIPHNPYPYLCLIMGPTGAGKSSFIEALAGESQQLSISKNQLAGYTQTVNAYKVVNLTWDSRPIYLVDTPGFSDSKISEVEIINMVRKWLKDNGLKRVERIYYLTPISETRMRGSRHRTIDMLQQFLVPSGSHRSVTFVTTMWDTLHNERTRMRAEANFAQLRDEVCMDFFGEEPVSITRFMNTRNSALKKLDIFCYYGEDSFSKPISSASPNLYQDLHERIERALQVKQMIESELAQPEAKSNADLRAILELNQRENHKTLTKFIKQFANFDPLPDEFRLAAQHLRKSIAANARPSNIKYRMLFWQWAHEPEISDDTDASLVPSQKLSFKGVLRPLVYAPKRQAAGSSKPGE